MDDWADFSQAPVGAHKHVVLETCGACLVGHDQACKGHPTRLPARVPHTAALEVGVDRISTALMAQHQCPCCRPRTRSPRAPARCSRCCPPVRLPTAQSALRPWPVCGHQPTKVHCHMPVPT